MMYYLPENLVLKEPQSAQTTAASNRVETEAESGKLTLIKDSVLVQRTYNLARI